MSLNTNKIEKIIFSNGLIREFKSEKSLLRQRIFFKEDDNETVKKLKLLVTVTKTRHNNIVQNNPILLKIKNLKYILFLVYFLYWLDDLFNTFSASFNFKFKSTFSLNYLLLEIADLRLVSSFFIWSISCWFCRIVSHTPDVLLLR